MNQPKGNQYAFLLLAFILILALGLRLYRIEGQSFWNDEGTSAALATRDLAAITRGAANDIHPPLYYYLLHFWTQVVGSGDGAIRSLSAVLGTLLVFLVYLIGRDSLGPRTGLLASLFAAISPLGVYYSQEARMYILVAVLGAASTLFFLRLLRQWEQQDAAPRHRLSAGCLVLSVLLLYSHYFAATVVLAQNVAFLAWLFTAPDRSLRAALRSIRDWAGLQALLVLSFVPWLVLVAAQLRRWPAISDPLTPARLGSGVLQSFSLGVAASDLPGYWVLTFGILLATGIVAALVVRSRSGGAWPTLGLLSYLVVPIVTMYVLSLQRPMYNVKFLLLGLAPFHLFLAQGVIWPMDLPGITRSRLARGLALAFAVLSAVTVAVLSLMALRAYYTDPRYARDDYRGIARYIEAVEQETDAILVNAPGQIETFARYYHGRSPMHPLPLQRPLDKEQTERELWQMVEGKDRVFAVLWATDESDPERFIEGWLDEHAYKAMDAWHGNVRLVVYALPEEDQETRIEYPLTAELDGRIRLLGYSLPRTEVWAGDILQLTLFWEARTPIEQRYKVFTHVMDAEGRIVGQRDAEPGGGARITTTWVPGQQVSDRYGLPILPAIPPGEYWIEVGMYSLESGTRLQVAIDGQPSGDRILLQPVRVLPQVAPPPLSVLEMKGQLGASFGDIQLLGYDLAKLGFKHDPSASLHAGDVVHLTLFWQATSQPSEDLAFELALQDAKGATHAHYALTPTSGRYPVRDWQLDEIVRDQYNLPLPPNLAPGRYRLRLTASTPPLSDAGAEVTVAHVVIQ